MTLPNKRNFATMPEKLNSSHMTPASIATTNGQVGMYYQNFLSLHMTKHPS